MRILTVLALCLALAPSAFAANAQQDRMKQCNADAKAKALKGDARKQFMSDCLSASGKGSPDAGPNSQQTKMKTCNAKASQQSLKGKARQDFMSGCLKG